MSGGRPAVYKPENVQIARRACTFWRCNRRRERWRRCAGTSTPVLIGVALAETAGTPSQARSGDQRFAHPVLIGVTLAEIAEIPSQASSGDQRFAH
jgi:hypothetical protein